MVSEPLIRGISGFAMDATPENLRKEMLDQILAMVTKMVLDLEACNADLKACTAAFRSAPPAFVADSDSSGSALAVHSASASPIPSPTSAPPHDADPVATDCDFCILFDTDARDVDCLSRLPDSLLRNIVARLPIKDAGRTAVLSHRWSPIWRAAPLLVVNHADLTVLRLDDSDRFYGLERRSPDGLLEQIRPQQEGHARLLLANHDLSAYTTARAWRPPWLRASRSTPSRRCCSPSRESALMPTPMLALKFLIRPYDPGAGFVGIYFNTEEAEQARVSAFAMDLLRRNGRTWPADLRTGVGTMLEADITANSLADHDPRSHVVGAPPVPRTSPPRLELAFLFFPVPAAHASHPPGEEFVAWSHAHGFRDPSGDHLRVANPTTNNLPAATELPMMVHTRCSTLRLNWYTYITLMAIPSSASVPASSATAPDPDTKLDIPAAAAKYLSVQHAGCLTSACILGAISQKSMLTSAIALTSTTAMNASHYFSISPTFVDKVQLCVDTSSTHELFEVLSLCLYVHSVDDRQCTEQILPKPPWSLVFPKDDSTNYDPSKHVWVLLLDSGEIQMLLLSSIQVKIHGSVHEMIALNINLHLVWVLPSEPWPKLVCSQCLVFVQLRIPWPSQPREKCRGVLLFHKACLSELCTQEQKQWHSRLQATVHVKLAETCKLLCSSPRVKGRLIILQLFFSFSQDHARVQIAAVNCVWIVWCFPSEHVSVDYLLACFGAQFGMLFLYWISELFVNANGATMDYKEWCHYVLFARGDNYRCNKCKVGCAITVQEQTKSFKSTDSTMACEFPPWLTSSTEHRTKLDLVAVYNQFTMMAQNMQREIIMAWPSSAWYMSLYLDIQMEQMQNDDMTLAHEKQWQNEKIVVCLKSWALYWHKHVTDQQVELWPWPWPSFSCCLAKACASALSYFEVSADSKYHKLLLLLKWSAQLLDLISMRKLCYVQATIQIICCNSSECAQPVFQIHVLAVATSQINTNYCHGSTLTKDGAYQVSFYIREHVSWDPGGLLQQRLGDKPCFKEGSMSWTYWAVAWIGWGHGPSMTWAVLLSFCQPKELDMLYISRSSNSTGGRRTETWMTAGCGSRLAAARFPITFSLPLIYVSRTF